MSTPTNKPNHNPSIALSILLILGFIGLILGLFYLDSAVAVFSIGLVYCFLQLISYFKVTGVGEDDFDPRLRQALALLIFVSLAESAYLGVKAAADSDEKQVALKLSIEKSIYALDKVTTRVEELDTQISTLKSLSSQLQIQNDSLQKSVEDARLKISAVDTAVANVNSQVTTLNNQAREITNNTKDIGQGYDQVREKRDAIVKELKDLLGEDGDIHKIKAAWQDFKESLPGPVRQLLN